MHRRTLARDWMAHVLRRIVTPENLKCNIFFHAGRIKTRRPELAFRIGPFAKLGQAARMEPKRKRPFHFAPSTLRSEPAPGLIRGRTAVAGAGGAARTHVGFVFLEPTYHERIGVGLRLSAQPLILRTRPITRPLHLCAVVTLIFDPHHAR